MRRSLFVEPKINPSPDGNQWSCWYDVYVRPKRMECQRATLSGASAQAEGRILRIQEETMNKDVLEGKWKEMRGQVKSWWGKLTDDDLDKAGGKADQIIGLLQQKYGYTKEHAEEEFNRRLKAAKLDK